MEASRAAFVGTLVLVILVNAGIAAMVIRSVRPSSPAQATVPTAAVAVAPTPRASLPARTPVSAPLAPATQTAAAPLVAALQAALPAPVNTAIARGEDVPVILTPGSRYSDADRATVVAFGGQFGRETPATSTSLAPSKTGNNLSGTGQDRTEFFPTAPRPSPTQAPPTVATAAPTATTPPPTMTPVAPTPAVPTAAPPPVSTATAMPTQAAAVAPPKPAGVASPESKHTCPRSHPIKGNQGSRAQADWIYWVPGSNNYGQTDPEQCFATTAEAEAAGYRAPRR